MTREDIIKFAREAGFADDGVPVIKIFLLERFAALVATAEREACAALADRAAAESHSTYEQVISAGEVILGLVAAGARNQAKKLAEAIRARGQQ